jgi:hypothetical protein
MDAVVDHTKSKTTLHMALPTFNDTRNTIKIIFVHIPSFYIPWKFYIKFCLN